MSLDRKIEELLTTLQKKGAEDVIIKLNRSVSTIVRYANNEITMPLINDESLISVYVGYKKRRLLTEINNLYFDPSQLADNLMKIASQLEEQDVYVSLPKEKFNYAQIVEPDEETWKISEEALDYVENVINESLNLGVKRTAGILKAIRSEIKCWSSTSLYLEDKRTGVSLSHRCFLDSTSTGQWAFSSRSIKDLNWKIVVEKASEICKANVNHKKIEPGLYNVVFAPMIFASLMEHVANASSAYSVEIGYSFFINKLGKKIASEALTLLDNPEDKRSAGYARFDDEGIPTRKKEIIKRGVLVTYLHNLTTAKRFNAETTGNAGVIFPMPWSIHVEPGNFEEEELLKELKRGLLIVNNWYLRFQNYQAGDFSTILRDGVFLIEDGEIKQALLGARLSDNFLNILSNIKALSKKVYPIQWWEVNTPTYVPYALVENVRITTAE